MEKKSKKPNNYNVTLETVGIKYRAENKTVGLAIDDIGLKWHQIKNKGTFTIRKGKKKVQRTFYATQLRRIFGSKQTRLLWGVRLQTLLK